MFDFLMSLSLSAIFQIILIDILLGGDNAVVIAMACRSLPPAQRNRAIWWGTAGAVVLRVALVSVAVLLLAVPFLKLAAGLMLLWIGFKLVASNDADNAEIRSSVRLFAAVKTIIIADAVMSIDNVIAIAGAAQSSGVEHQFALIVLGLLVSIPVIVWGSHIVLKIFDRFPAVTLLGGGMLGWIGGGLVLGEPMLASWIAGDDSSIAYVVSAVSALLVVAAGWAIRRRERYRYAAGLR